MVSKTVIVAFVALCCAQAFVAAAPYDEEEMTELGAHHFGSYIKCAKDLAQGISVIKDFSSIVGDVKKIFSEANAAKMACSTVEDASPEAVKACKKQAQDKEVKDIMAEAVKIGEKAKADWPKVNEIIKECF